MSRGQHGYYTAFYRNVKNFFQILQTFFFGRGVPLPKPIISTFSSIMQSASAQQSSAYPASAHHFPWRYRPW